MKPARATRQAARRPMDDARLLISRLSPARLGIEEVLRRICRIAARTLNVERVGIWLFGHDGTELRTCTLYESSRHEYSHGTTLRVADFPAYFESLRVRKTIPAEHAAEDPRTRELLDTYLEPLGIEAMLDAPILLEGDVIGVVCHEHTGEPREWTTEERDFAGSVADCVSAKIERAEAGEVQRLRQLDAERQAVFRRRDSIAQLSAGVAHDFRNLLTIIVGNTQEIRLAAGQNREVVELAETVLDTAHRGAALASQLMELAGGSSGQPKVIDLAEETRRLLPLLQRAAGDRHTVELTETGQAGRVFLDPSHLERMLLNLVVNARDAMVNQAGGRIALILHDENGAQSEGNTHRLVLEVCDDGPGIPPEMMPRIFDPFFSTKQRHEGSGLGLAVVRHLAELAGGSITVRNLPARGAMFRIVLPRVAG